MKEGEIRARVESVRAGDDDAFGEIFRALAPDVERLCARLLGSGPDAEDAASDVFLRARSALESYDPRQPFRRWLLAIGAHHCIDRLRRRAKEPRPFDPEVLDARGDDASHASPLGGLLRDEQRRAVLAAIDALPDRYRAPIVLRYYAELDYAAIAELMELSRTQVGALLFRAKGRLRVALATAARRGEVP